jgi:integrase
MRAHFTDSWVARLRYKADGAAQQLYWDDQTEGLGLRVSPAGSIAWVLQHKGARKTIGRYPGVTLDAARKAADDLVTGGSAIKRFMADPPLQHALAYYIIGRKKGGRLRDSTAADYVKTVKRYLAPYLDRKIGGIKPQEVRAWYSEICEKSVAKANYTFRVLRAVYAFYDALHPELGLGNPVSVLSTLGLWRTLEPKRRVVPRDKLHGWFAALDQAPPRLRTVCLLAMLLGLRIENASGLRIEWYDSGARVLRIPRENMKGDAFFDLPVGPALAALLDAAKPAAAAGWFFPALAPDDDGHYREFYGAVGTVAKRAGVKFSPHDLRRTFATVAHSLGYTDITIGRLLSHSLTAAPRDLRVTGGYIIDSCETLRIPVEAVEREVMRLAGRADLLACPVECSAVAMPQVAAPAAPVAPDYADGDVFIV